MRCIFTAGLRAPLRPEQDGRRFGQRPAVPVTERQAAAARGAAANGTAGTGSAGGCCGPPARPRPGVRTAAGGGRAAVTAYLPGERLNAWTASPPREPTTGAASGGPRLPVSKTLQSGIGRRCGNGAGRAGRSLLPRPDVRPAVAACGQDRPTAGARGAAGSLTPRPGTLIFAGFLPGSRPAAGPAAADHPAVESQGGRLLLAVGQKVIRLSAQDGVAPYPAVVVPQAASYLRSYRWVRSDDVDPRQTGVDVAKTRLRPDGRVEFGIAAGAQQLPVRETNTVRRAFPAVVTDTPG